MRMTHQGQGNIMQFILVPGSIRQFANIRNDYEEKRKINLEATPSMLGMPTIFGGTDVKNRRKQISFVEKMNCVLNRFLFEEEEIKTAEQWQANLMASRIMIAVALYIQNQIGSSKDNSALYRLINTYLGVSSENFFDDEDQESCYQTAAKLINQQDALTHINAELRIVGGKEFTKEEWEQFVSFIKNEVCKKNAPLPVYNKYPVTTLIQPIFETAFSYVGSTIGWVVAEALSNSSAAITPRLKVTSLVGSLLVMGPAGATGVALLAPVIASRLLSSFCTISLASMSGATMAYVGKGTGVLVGLPFDLVYNLLRATGSLIVSYSTAPPHLAPLNGIRIADGVYVAQGNPMQFNLVPQYLVSDINKQRLQITDKGEIFVDEQPVTDTSNNMALVIKELNEQLSEDSDTFTAQTATMEP